MEIGEIIPILGILTGIIIPIVVFLWLYHENKNKYAAVVEISKNLDDSSKAETNKIPSTSNENLTLILGIMLAKKLNDSSTDMFKISAMFLFLYFIGTGPVKGFAITLSVGIVTSMFTAIMCTRAMVNIIYGNKNIKELKI